MGWLDQLKFLVTKRAQPARTILAYSTLNAVGMPRHYDSFADEAYQKNVTAYSCVSMIASSCASIPWILYNKEGDELINHPILQLLSRPNPLDGTFTFFESTIAYLKIAGNSYIRIIRNLDNQPAELWTIRPDRIKIEPGLRRIPRAYIYRTYDQSGVATDERLEVDQITGQSDLLHLKHFHPLNDWYGLSPVEAAVFNIDSHNESNRMYLSLLKNGARPGGAFVFQGQLGNEQYGRLKQQLDTEFKGTGNTGRPMVLDGGLDWKNFSFSPDDMSWIEGKNTSARDIALAFKVPPMLLGIPGDNTYSNYKEARQAFYETVVVPQALSIRDQLNTWLTPQFEQGLYLDIDQDAIDALSPKRNEIWDRVEKATYLTINEKREALGYEPVLGGDSIYISGIQTPLDDVNADSIDDDSVDADLNNLEGDNEDADSEETSNEKASKARNQKTRKLRKKTRYTRFATPHGIKRKTGEEEKLINPRDDRDRSREWRRTILIRNRFEKRFERQLRAHFDVEQDSLLDAVSNLDGTRAQAAAKREIKENEKKLKALIEQNLLAIGQAFGTRVFDALKTSPLEWELKSSDSKFQEALRNYVKNRAGQMVANISDTTQEKVLSAIREAMLETFDAGEGAPPLAERITQAIKKIYSGDSEEETAGFTEARSTTIARTETVAASNAASIEAARATGINNLLKEWVSSDDERTRTDHRRAHAQRKKLDEPFKVGDIEMMMPGDGPVDQVVNCRCTMAYVGGFEE